METEHDILYRKWNQEEIVPIKEWFYTLLVMSIPIINIIMIGVWAISPNTNPNKVNFIKAQLLLFIAGFIIWWLIHHFIL